MQAQVPAGSAIEPSMPGYLSAGFPGIYRGIAAKGAGHCANVEVPISQSNTGYPAKSACEVGSLTERCAEAFLVHRKELRMRGNYEGIKSQIDPNQPMPRDPRCSRRCRRVLSGASVPRGAVKRGTPALSLP